MAASRNVDQASLKTGKKPRGRPSKRADKRAKLIEGATALFNARGISATSVSDVSEAIDISRATAYYYVKNRSELVLLCYRRACEIAAEDLTSSADMESGLARLQSFVRLALTPDRSPVAVLTEINSLAPEIASEIQQFHASNVDRLTEFVSAGQADGSIRECDARLVAQSVIGMLSWTQLLPQWSESNHGDNLRRRAADSLVDFISNGVGAPGQPAVQCPLAIADYLPRLDDIFDRDRSAALKLERVLATASKLFNRHGIEATSLDQIAAQLGLTKGVIYHYLDDKPDLVRKCYERSFRLYDRFVEDAKTAGSTGLESALFNSHLNAQAQASEVSPLMPQPGFEALPDKLRKQLQALAREQNRSVANLLERGISEGTARPCDAGLVTHLFAGALGWIPKWVPEDDPRTPKELADALADLAQFGIAAS